MTGPVNLAAVLGSFDELWSPRIVARVNDYDVRVAKFDGDYVWHSHADTDEFFLVVHGDLVIRLCEVGVEREVRLGPGDTFVVPRGTPHVPVTTAEAHILMIEPSGTVTVGDTTDVPERIAVTTGVDATRT